MIIVGVRYPPSTLARGIESRLMQAFVGCHWWSGRAAQQHGGKGGRVPPKGRLV